MKHISVVIPKGEIVLSCLDGVYKVFGTANTYLKESGEREDDYFKIDLVGIEEETSIYQGVFGIHPNRLIDQVRKTDLVIIPAISGDIGAQLQDNAPYFDWIRKMYSLGAEVASLCMGAFILASTGLVDGKSCTTHWLGIEGFEMMFPQVNLVPEKVVTDENGIYTSGGAYSFLNLLFHIAEKYCGRECALYVAKVLEIEVDRHSQAQFSIFRGQKSHQDQEIIRAQNYIESNVEEKISVEDLADMVALSRRNFIRRFKNATQNTPLEYIQRVKIEKAKKSLESSTETVNEIMYSVGYADGKSFRNAFRKITGLSPVEYKNKYNRHIAMNN